MIGSTRADWGDRSVSGGSLSVDRDEEQIDLLIIRADDPDQVHTRRMEPVHGDLSAAAPPDSTKSAVHPTILSVISEPILREILAKMADEGETSIGVARFDYAHFIGNVIFRGVQFKSEASF